jgi:preprotein translocase subunit Sss1
MNREQIDTLFKQYESAFNKLDLKTISGFYSDTFMSAGPKGAITQSKKEFEEKAQEAVEFYKSIGQNSARIISRRTIPISNEYSMVVIRWGVTFAQTGSKVIEFDVSYFVQEIGEPRIIMFIAHEDEEAAMQKLGIRPKEKENI